MQLKHSLPAASPPPTSYHTGPAHGQTRPSQPLSKSATANVPVSSMTSLPRQVTTSARAMITPDGLIRIHASVTTAGGDFRAPHHGYPTMPPHKDRLPQAPLFSSPPLTTTPLDLTMLVNDINHFQSDSPPSSLCFMPNHHAPSSTRPMQVVDLCDSDSPSPPSSPESQAMDLDSPPPSLPFTHKGLTVIDIDKIVDLDSQPFRPQFASKGLAHIHAGPSKSPLSNSNVMFEVRKKLTELD